MLHCRRLRNIPLDFIRNSRERNNLFIQPSWFLLENYRRITKKHFIIDINTTYPNRYLGGKRIALCDSNTFDKEAIFRYSYPQAEDVMLLKRIRYE